MRFSAFIPPCIPTLRDRLPKCEGWQFELKFDGYRVQLHKAGASSTLFGRNGAIHTPLPGHRRGRPRAPDEILHHRWWIAAGRHDQPDFLCAATRAICVDVRLLLRSA